VNGALAEIDARGGDQGELAATAMVGGIPLVVRPLRQLARLGWTRARVIASDPAAVRAALARYPVPGALAVEVMAGAPDDRATLRLDARALYRREDLTAGTPEPIVRVRTRPDTAEAVRVLERQIRKSVQLDGVVTYYAVRPLIRPLSRALLDTRVSPNQVTVAALVAGLCAAACAFAGGRGPTIAAGLLYWFGFALDCVDGELARMRISSSKLGEWLDAMADEISGYAMLAGLGVGLWRDGAAASWLLIGVGGSAIGALTVARLYVDLHRRGLPIDTAQFPWFFNPPPGVEVTPSRAGRVLNGLGYLVRRDANVTGVALLLLLDQRRIAIALVALGAAIAAIVTITHYIVMAARQRR
jgi:phosphatidylglycerophosphate synthase